MEEIVVGILFMLLAFTIFPLYLWRRRQISRSDREEQPQIPQREAVVRQSATRRMRRRPAAASTSAAAAATEGDALRNLTIRGLMLGFFMMAQAKLPARITKGKPKISKL